MGSSGINAGVHGSIVIVWIREKIDAD